MSDHGHGHHPNQAHHFDTLEQQIESGKLGMWLFLSTEVLLFAGLFCAYTVYRTIHPEVFEFASKYLDTTWGAINTLVLIASSWTVAMAVRSSALGQQKQTSIFLVLTLLGALGFMGIKAVEYNHKFHKDLKWGLGYNPENSKPQDEHWAAWNEKQAREAKPEDEAPQRLLASATPSYTAVEPGADLESSSTIASPPSHVAPTAEAAPEPQVPGLLRDLLLHDRTARPARGHRRHRDHLGAPAEHPGRLLA
jgi:hypothetical protein